MSSEQKAWADAMARWGGLVDATAERARRRDMFAAAALSGLLARPTIDDDPLEFHFLCEHAHKWADAMLAASDATAGPTNVSVPPSPATRPGETERP